MTNIFLLIGGFAVGWLCTYQWYKAKEYLAKVNDDYVGGRVDLDPEPARDPPRAAREKPARPDPA